MHVYFDDDKSCYDAYNIPWGVAKFLIKPRTYYVGVMNEALNRLIGRHYDVFVTANNDQEFFVPGWDTIALAALNQNFDDGMGVIEIGSHEGLSFNTFISRTKFWTEHYDGKLFDPRFMQYFADAHRMKSLEENGWFLRLAPGLVHTYAAYDEVKVEGFALWARDSDVVWL